MCGSKNLYQSNKIIYLFTVKILVLSKFENVFKVIVLLHKKINEIENWKRFNLSLDNKLNYLNSTNLKIIN